jgi:hypothetical protein
MIFRHPHLIVKIDWCSGEGLQNYLKNKKRHFWMTLVAMMVMKIEKF